ncbi:hypothetical protein C0J52_08565 [Blattella germanica]|nr:hypothetical protein C0J52_08565 [Blattella germanica]
MLLYTCVALLLIGSTYAALPLPRYIKPCATSDPDFNKCAMSRARTTIENVLKVTEIKVDNNGPQQAGIAFTLKNCKFYGPGDAEVTELNLDFDKLTLYLRIKIPRIMVVGKYDVKGRVLLLPITGKGDVNVTLGPEMNRVLNDNWQESFKELSPPVLEAISTIVATIVNGITTSVPYNEIFPETI